MLPRLDIVRIRYFTARVTNLPTNPGAADRQQAYLRALETLPEVTIHFGQFLTSTERRPLVHPPENGSPVVEVSVTREKASDVNLASYLLADGYEDEYETAVVVSNDSDLYLPIEMVRTRLGKEVGVLDPSNRRSFRLKGVASWYRYRSLRQGPLSASLFPSTLQDADGRTIHKPSAW